MSLGRRSAVARPSLGRRSAVVALSLTALGFSESVEETDVTASWADAVVALDTTVGEVDVILELRLTHGEDDLYWTEGPFHLEPEQTTLVEPDWPDLSIKGAQLAIPGGVSGVLRVTGPQGEDLGPRILPLRSILIGSEPTVFAAQTLDAFLPAGVSAGPDEVIASINPTVVLP